MLAELKKISKQNLAITGLTFGVLAFWVFSRVANINPAILQDEFVYTYSSRRIGYWDQTPAYDFGNYLFNFIYSSTLLCGDSFYTCGKVLNLFFFSAFVFTLLLIALRYLPFWWSLGFAVIVYLSPLSVYVSMYLPESLYFFLIASSVLVLSYALESDSWRHWLIAGALLGAAGLAKPHALISLMAIGIFVFIYSLGKRPIWRPMVIRGFSFLGGYLALRLSLGFALAGPKALDVFGAYGASSGVGDLVGSVATGDLEQTESLVGAGSVEGALGLFPIQIVTHTNSVLALLGASVAAILLVVIMVAVKRQANPAESFVLLTAVWLGVMVVSIVLFTGWVTGSGDDHTTRILLRYYDFIFPIVGLASLVAIHRASLLEAKLWQRWLAAALPVTVSGLAFSGFFGTLTIQIADAPNLAGLVSERFSFDGVSVLGFAALLMLAFYPQFFKFGLAAALTFTFSVTGFFAQEQYSLARGADSPADTAGQYIAANYPLEVREQIAILASSRFDARIASLWMDADNELVLAMPGSNIPTETFIEEPTMVLVLGDFSLEQETSLVVEGEGFSLRELVND